MPRTFRHNEERSRGVEPARCELCHEWTARWMLDVYRTGQRITSQELCTRCVHARQRELRGMGLEFVVAELA